MDSPPVFFNPSSPDAGLPVFWLVVPAAGIGKRMGADIPKQYLHLAGKTVLEHSVERLLQLPSFKALYLVLDKADEYWSSLPLANHPAIRRVDGGVERADSVLNGLKALPAAENDWVLVHDAARPCVTLDAIKMLMNKVCDHPVGGILAVPVSDTLKSVESENIEATQDRSKLWQAQTPQMFRYGLLRNTLEQALINKMAVTDESSAVEMFGHQPMVVAGRSDNIKITRPEDLPMATFILQQQAHSVEEKK